MANQTQNTLLMNLTNQIAQLIQQLQTALMSQGDQDPISWIEEVEIAFEANQMICRNQVLVIDCWDDNAQPQNSFKLTFIYQFRMPALETAFERAKAFESALYKTSNLSTISKYPQQGNGYLYIMYSQPLPVFLASTSMSESKVIIEKLVEAVNKMTMQLQEKKKFFREYSKEYLAKVICYKCGKPGHISRMCQENVSNTKNLNTGSDMNITVNKEEEGWPLFMPAERQECKRSSVNVLFREFQKGSTESTRAKINEDLIQKEVSIDEALLEELLEEETELDRSLKRKKVMTKRKLKNNINIVPEIRSTALYCDVKVLDKVFSLILDSGSSGSIISSYFLRELEITSFLFEVGGVKVPVDVVATAEMSFLWEDKEIIVPVEFCQITCEFLERNRPSKTRELYEEDKDENMSEGSLTDEDAEFDNENLETQIYEVSSFDDFFQPIPSTIMQGHELHEELLMSWESEDDCWFDDKPLPFFPSNTVLISLDSDEEPDNSYDEVLISSLPLPTPNSTSNYCSNLSCENLLALRSSCYALVLSTDKLVTKAYEPITDLLDFCYKKKTPEILYHNDEGYNEVISYTSQDIMPAEKNYTTIEKKCLVAVWAV
ncbi:21070_t:CDS:2, partial [Cetraspora pellucida]